MCCPCLVRLSQNYKKNKILSNLNKANKQENIEIFHAGTKLVKNKFYSNGGRVLSVTASSSTLEKQEI